MFYDKNRINEAVYIYEQIATAKRLGGKSVEISNIDYDENIQSLRNIGYSVIGTKNGIKVEWKEI